MGVTNLWQILAPVQQHKKLSCLKGQTLAVDLSIWVCENQCVKQMQGVVTRPYLRNLYFRISYLLQHEINLIFAVEGEAPDLKHETMSRRQEAQYPGKKKGGPPKPRKQGRSQFNAKLRECCEMLDYLGVPYIQSRGEAEALCGLLNAAGIVDGCITNDGDVFLYGAKTVYRNFTINSKDPHVETYQMVEIEKKLNLDREKMVALALLVGCDYVPKGVPGVGIEKASKLLTSYNGISPLERFKRWRTLTDSDCYDSIEVQVKRKAASVMDFPQRKVIDEFLIPKDSLPSRKLTWKRPKLQQLQTFSLTKLEWPEEYTQEKVLPLITLWDMADIIKGGNQQHLVPHRIVKARIRHGIPSLEVQWFKQDSDQVCKTDYYVTIENKELFSHCFPHFMEEFDQQTVMKKCKSKGQKKKLQDTENNVVGDVACEEQDLDFLTNRLGNLDLNPETEVEINKEKQANKCPISNLSGKRILDLETKDTGRNENFSIIKGDVIDLNSFSSDEMDDEIEISYAEENLSLRSRLLRKVSSDCAKTTTQCKTKFDSDSDIESDIDSATEFSKIKVIKSNVNLPLVNQNIAEHSDVNNKDDEYLECTKQTPNKESHGHADSLEDHNMKIYSVSDFSHIGKLNVEINTPNLSRLKNLSPALYQTLLESTPTSSCKLRKAALLNSILNSPLQVENILCMMRKNSNIESPMTADIDLKSVERSVNNLSCHSMNGSNILFGDFHIESSLLKSIISSGGSTTYSPMLNNCDVTTSLRALVTGTDETIVGQKTTNSVVSKLTFDVNSPSQKELRNAKLGLVSSPVLEIKSEKSVPNNENSIVIDLTSDTPNHDNCRVMLDISYNDGQSNQKSHNNGQSNQKSHNNGQSNQKSHNDGQSNQKSHNDGQFNQKSHNDGQFNQKLNNNGQSNQKSNNNGQSNQKSHNDGQSNQKSAFELSLKPEKQILTERENNMSSEIDKAQTILPSLDYRLIINDHDEMKYNLVCGCQVTKFANSFVEEVSSSVLGKQELSFKDDTENKTALSYTNDETNHTMDALNIALYNNNIDILSPLKDKTVSQFSCVLSPVIDEKENEPSVQTSKIIKTVIDMSCDEKSPVSLADRLRRRLNVTSMKSVLQEVTGNK